MPYSPPLVIWLLNREVRISDVRAIESRVTVVDIAKLGEFNWCF